MLVLTIQVTLKSLITKYQWNTALTHLIFVKTINSVKFSNWKAKNCFTQFCCELTHFQA